MKVFKYDIEYNENRLPALVSEGAAVYDGRRSLTSSKDVWEFIRDALRIDKKTEEHFVIVAVDRSMKPLGVFDVSKGTLSMSYVGMRETFQRLLMVGAACFFAAHNHPSGDVTPSRIDITSTEDLAKAADFMKIPLIDHIIIAPNGAYYSFYEHNNVLGGKR